MNKFVCTDPVVGAGAGPVHILRGRPLQPVPQPGRLFDRQELRGAAE